ncbi:MAG: ribbon-helix-helix domain-containing protein [Terracidiphilus sp.]
MARIPFTLRIDAEELAALKHLRELNGKPISELLDQAIKIYLRKRSSKEPRLERGLSALQKYRKRDRGSEGAIAAFVGAEARLEDPIEGKPVEGHFVGGQFQQAGPVQSKIRELRRTGEG